MPLKHPLPWILLLAGACSSAPPPPPPPSPGPPPPDRSPRLIQVGSALYVRNAPGGLIKDHLLYALSADPLPGTDDHPKIGILRGVDRTGASLKVAWYTLPDDDDVARALARDGLPIRLIDQDLEPRIGRHWGKYLPQPRSTFRGPGGAVELELNLGKDDGLLPGDKYEVLGEPRADAQNRTVDSFAPLGTCTVPPFAAEATRARCQLDRGEQASAFGEQHWTRGGYVKAITPRAKPSPP